MRINVSRFMSRETAEFSIEVLTPMFLGGADGNGELRAAPLKNAIRYWWRIVLGELSHQDLLKEEQSLFGGVTGEANRSLVDLVVKGSLIRDVDKTDSPPSVILNCLHHQGYDNLTQK